MKPSIALNERRILTVLSVDIVGSTRLVSGLDPDDAQDLLDTVFYRIQAAVERRGGTTVAFTGDGALVVFGWPEVSEAHSDNACLAAWDIQNNPKTATSMQEDVLVRIGIASGLAVVREVAMGLVSRYDIVGDVAHRAAALQKNAPAGGILVCTSTQDLSRGAVQGEPVRLDLGLRTGPVSALPLVRPPFEKTGDLLLKRHSAPIVGRGRELNEIGRLFESVEGRIATLACIGEPGLGKSRLAAAACELARTREQMVLVHECRDLDSASPFAAARAIISLAIEAGARVKSPAEAFDFAGCRTDDRAATLAIFEIDEPDKRDVGQEVVSQTRVARALAQMLGAGVLSGASLIVVEDIHNLDPESAQVLALLRNVLSDCPLALFATGRPEALDLASSLASEVIRLAPLDERALHAMIAAVVEDAMLSEAVQRAVISHAAGNPFLLMQLLQSPELIGQGSKPALPRTVEALIHARLDRLSPTARGAAQMLGALGETVDPDIAAAAAGTNGAIRAETIHELQRHAFIDAPRGGAIRFRHALIAAGCASTLSRTRRQAVHHIALTVLAGREGDRSQLYPRLAHHAEQSGRDDQAVEYYWSACRRARSLNASQSLTATFERALACCERLGAAGDARFVDFVLLVFETFHLQGSMQRIEPHLQKAAEYARRQGRRDKVCIAQSHLGILAWYHGRFAEGERIMRPTLHEAKSLGHLPLRFAAQFILAQQLHNLGQIEEAVTLVEELCGLLSGELEQARLGAMGLPAAIAHAHKAYYLLEVGRYKEAETSLDKALEIAARGTDAYSESLARIALGRCYLLTEQNAAAVKCLELGTAIIERQGYDPALLNVSGLLATALSRAGRPEQGVALAERRLSEGRLGRAGSYEHHYFWAGYAEALICTGREDEGLARIEDAVAIGRSTQNPCILVQSLALKAAALDRSGAASSVAALQAEVRTLEQRYGLVAPAAALYGFRAC